MNVAILFECSGKVRDAFRALGHNAVSVDIQPDDNDSQYHYEMDIEDFFTCEETAQHCFNAPMYDLIIMHPPCTALACSGNRWYGKGMPRHEERQKSTIQTVQWLNRAKNLAHHVALENPVGVLSDILGKPQYIQPWQFGHGETKKTGLWLYSLPELQPTKIVEGRENRIWRMPPSEGRAKMRSETYQGIADAMAKQWSEYILDNKGENNDTVE